MAKSTTMKRSGILTQIKIGLLCPLILLLPLFVLLLSPIFIYRYLVVQLSKLLRSDLGEIVSPTSALYASSDIYVKPRSSLLVLMFLEGQLDVEEVCRELTSKVMSARTSDGRLKYPQLQQYIFSWMGYFFWKWEPAFELHNHVRKYQGKVKYDECLDEAILLQISNELLNKPFAFRQSPWEFLVLPEYRPNPDDTPGVAKTVLILRIHHVLGDGISITKLLAEELGGLELVTSNKNRVSKSVCGKIIDSLTFGFRLPYDVASTLVNSSDPFNQLHLEEAQLSRSLNIVTSSKIPMSRIKEVRDLNNASFTGIVLAAFTGALRTLMLTKLVESVPEYINTGFPLPLPGRPHQALVNHFTGAIVRLPVGLSDPETRLHVIEANLKALKKSTFPIFVHWANIVAGALLPSMNRFYGNQNGLTVGVSNFSGPYKQFSLFERLLTDVFGLASMDGVGTGLISFSFNGNIRFAVGIDESILSGQDTQGEMSVFMANMLNELNILKQQRIV